MGMEELLFCFFQSVTNKHPYVRDRDRDRDRQREPTVNRPWGAGRPQRELTHSVRREADYLGKSFSRHQDPLAILIPALSPYRAGEQ